MKRMAALGTVLLLAASTASGSCIGIAASAPAAEQDLIRKSLVKAGDMIDHINAADSMQLLSADETAEIDAKMAAYQAKEDSLLRNKAENYYYYETLEGEAKQIYDVLLTVASDPTTIDNYGLMMTTMDPSSEEFLFQYTVAYWSMVFDHPELFWLYNTTEISISYGSDGNNMNGIYLVYFGQDKAYENYYTEMEAFNSAADEFLSHIDTGVSDYEIVKQVHDRLIQLVTYDDAVLEAGNDGYYNLAHTAYGALVADSEGNANYAVCDGYTLAMEYLLQQCGVEVVFNAGMAGRDELNAGGHAWNLVKLDGKWYELDSTWDDNEDWENDYTPSDQGYDYIMAAFHDADYAQKLRHYLFLLSTERFRNFTPGDSLYFTASDGMTFTMLGDSVHVRFESDGTTKQSNAQASVLSNAPVAEESFAAE
ncbi:MAG: hypothetical protein Q4B09_08995 [Lachnospiraceae bacterium]|nr:hypothetical protein [Lachnospiraceae bacterium]